MNENNIIEAACKYLAGLFDTIRDLEKNLKTVGEIIQAIDLQEVAKLLEMPAGTNISPNVVPYLKILLQRFDALRVAHDESLELLEVRAGQIDRYEKAEERHKAQATPSPNALERAMAENAFPGPRTNAFNSRMTATEIQIAKNNTDRKAREKLGHVQPKDVSTRLFHPNPGDEDGHPQTERYPTEIPTESDLEDQGADDQ